VGAEVVASAAMATQESDEALFEAIRTLIANHLGVSPERVTMETRLFQDLRVDGLDAEELLVKYKDQFDVNLDAFPYDDYFGPELAFNPIYWLFWWLVDRSKLEMKELRVRDLVDAARAGTWSPRD
jgi:acyl carrier protein